MVGAVCPVWEADVGGGRVQCPGCHDVTRLGTIVMTHHTSHSHTGNTDPDWAAVKTNNKLGANRGETYLGEEIIIV